MDLSILIPARNEQFLAKTIEDILENIEGDTEIIAICDGNWPEPPIPDHPQVHLIYHAQSIGQRAATNEAARLSTAKFIMKCDAHCAFDKGFDVKLMADCEYNWTIVPRMYNLHAFDWECRNCQHRLYQGPKPDKCPECDCDFFEMVIIWKEKHNPTSDFMRFDSNLQFQYWRDFKKRPEAQKDLAETMSLLGACWLMHRERYWELGGLDEAHGSWGQMGTEIACKTWLSGGRLLVNKKTWFAHMFRTQPGFAFPYPISNRAQEKAREYSHWLWIEGNWPKAIHPLSWLIEKFAPVPGWDVQSKIQKPITEPTKGIVYYTDNRLDKLIFEVVQKQIIKSDLPIVSTSLQPLDFGKNIVLESERGYLTMFRQILIALETSTADIIFFCEHDILYHPTHFDFMPARRDVYYYNENTWKVDYQTGRALFYFCKQTSGLCAYRDLLISHYRERVNRTESKLKELGNSRAYRNWIRRQGFEPGSHGRKERVDNLKAESWMSEYPNVDIRHQYNLTPNRWRQEQFRDKRNCRGWIEADTVPGWGKTQGCFQELLRNGNLFTT